MMDHPLAPSPPSPASPVASPDFIPNPELAATRFAAADPALAAATALGKALADLFRDEMALETLPDGLRTCLGLREVHILIRDGGHLRPLAGTLDPEGEALARDADARGEVRAAGDGIALPLETAEGSLGILLVRREAPTRAPEEGLSALVAAASALAHWLRHREILERIRLRENNFLRMQDLANFGFFDVEGGTFRWQGTPELWRLYGLDPQRDTLDMRFLQKVIHPEDLTQFLSGMRRLFEESVPLYQSCRVRRHDGALRHFVTLASAVPDGQGRARWVTGITRDVTRERELMANLREQEARYRQLVDNALDVIWVWHPGTGFSYLSPSVEAMLGFTPAQLQDLPATQYMSPPSLERLLALTERAQAGEEVSAAPLILEMRHADGHPVWVEARIRALRDEEGRVTAYLGASRDISERRRLQAEQRRQEKVLREVFEGHASMMLLVDPRSLRILEANRAARAFYGITPERLANLKVTDLNVMPLPWIQKVLSEVADGQRDSIITRHRTGSGEVRDVQVHVSRTDAPEGRYIFAIIHDITDQVRAEVALRKQESHARRLAEENARLLEQSRREADIKSMLLEEVNHRVKNNLAAIVGMLDMESQNAAERHSGSVRAFQDLKDRIYALATVHELLSASEWQPIDLADLCLPVIQGSLANARCREQVTVDLTRPPTPVRVNPRMATALTIILAELTTNSAKHAFAHRVGGRIRVTLEHLEDPAGRVRLVFSDDGPGFPLDALRGARDNIGFRIMRLNIQNLPHGNLSMANRPGAETTLVFQPVPASPEREAMP